MSAAEELVTNISIRRFEEPDLNTHGGWVMKRLTERYPHHNERFMATFLRGLIYSNEYLFLYQDHSVCLAQMVRTKTLDAQPVVQELFVWAQDPDNALHTQEAANFYDRMIDWARGMGIDTILVEEDSDVPHEKIKERLGRIFTRDVKFARV